MLEFHNFKENPPIEKRIVLAKCQTKNGEVIYVFCYYDGEEFVGSFNEAYIINPEYVLGWLYKEELDKISVEKEIV